YGRNLTRQQRNEWDKVNGRFRTLTFNEPVEQMLLIASKVLGQTQKEVPDNLSDLMDTIDRARVYPLRDYFDLETTENLFPLDPLAGAVITMALQLYGQNERSLFTFLHSEETQGVNAFLTERGDNYFHVGAVYDYLFHHLHFFLETTANRHHMKWRAIRESLEVLDGEDYAHKEEAQLLLKVIGLLALFAPQGANLDTDFLNEYLAITAEVTEVEAALAYLEKKHLIRYTRFNRRYSMTIGTDLDFSEALEKAEAELAGEALPVLGMVQEALQNPATYLAAKEISYQVGTPRFFAVHVSDRLAKIATPWGETDGIIQLLFSKDITEEEVKATSREGYPAVLFGLYTEVGHLEFLLLELAKVRKVMEDNLEDRAALRELKRDETQYLQALAARIHQDLFSGQAPIQWYWQGENKTPANRKAYNQLLSKIMRETYPATPQFRNEMVNKSRLSSALATARKALVVQLLANPYEEDLGIPDQSFPPEKTVYRALLRETGMHFPKDGGYQWRAPQKGSGIESLWEASQAFLETTRSGKRLVADFVESLLAPPYKLKQGLVEFWVPIFLFIQHNEYALYGENDQYIPKLTPDILDLVVKTPQKYNVKAFNLSEINEEVFRKYRQLLDLDPTVGMGGEQYTATVRPFLTFYRGLSPYAQATRQITVEAQNLRQAMKQAKDVEKALFEDFPEALHFRMEDLRGNEKKIEDYRDHLQAAIDQLKHADRDLKDHISGFISQSIAHEDLTIDDWKARLQNRYTDLPSHRLGPEQVRWLKRMQSTIEEPNAYLDSLVQGVCGKKLDKFTDEDIPRFQDQWKAALHALDNLVEVSEHAESVPQDEEIFKVELTSLGAGTQAEQIRVPKARLAEAQGHVEKLKAALGTDRDLLIAILYKLLHEEHDK
ncbi:MAG TPA: hypothetical protein DCE41_16285, partial [Cytophagales bacterium]|nr:hypothetical protein [Cytophagales bacterium]